MVTITNFFIREGKDNKPFVALELSGDIELVNLPRQAGFMPQPNAAVFHPLSLKRWQNRLSANNCREKSRKLKPLLMSMSSRKQERCLPFLTPMCTIPQKRNSRYRCYMQPEEWERWHRKEGGQQCSPFF